MQEARGAVGVRLLRVKPVEFGGCGGAGVYLGVYVSMDVWALRWRGRVTDGGTCGCVQHEVSV